MRRNRLNVHDEQPRASGTHVRREEGIAIVTGSSALRHGRGAAYT
jgi:hypothetical protein